MKSGMDIHTRNPNTWEAKAHAPEASLCLIKAWGRWLEFHPNPPLLVLARTQNKPETRV